MRITIVIVALIGLLSMAMDTTREVEMKPDNAWLSSQVVDSTIAAASLDAEQVKAPARDHNPAHLTDVRWLSELGSFVLIGVALVGFITAPQRKIRNARSKRHIV